MNLPDIFNSMGLLMKEFQVSEILSTNEETGKRGLILTEKEAAELVESRSRLLQGYGRIELDMEAAKKLVVGLSASPFVCREDFAVTVRELQEVFYYLKNETEDELGDDRLIEAILELFDSSCGGSVELLRGKGLEEFIREYRRERSREEYLYKGGYDERL